ncbi:MAG: alpha/beta fold hydrolase [Comamonadaceae bacterium]|nr:MAG: alpha/beta fold hydrolase [Comamonadaceae bacterium]
MTVPSRLAWLLRTVCAVQVAAIVLVVAWRWPDAPLQAIAAGLGIALIAPVVLGIEFVLLAIVARSDATVPRATSRQLLSAWASETANLLRVFYWRLPFRWRTPVDFLAPMCAGRTGVVLVHGFVCNRGFWAPWMRQLRILGRAHVAVNLEPVFVSIDAYTDAIDAAVRRVAETTGCPPVLVCHSMGGLAARAWLRAAGTNTRVAHVVTIGSPHHGTWLGRFSSMPNGKQMRQASPWLTALQDFEESHPLPAWTCWYSNCDNIVFPASTATLPNARNRLLPGVPHVAMAFDPLLMAETLRILEAPTAQARW